MKRYFHILGALVLFAASSFAQQAANLTPPLAELGWKNVTWQNVNPGAGGNIQSIALDPNTPGRLFFCSDMEGHYRSDDYGQTWAYIGADLSYSYVNCVEVEPGNAQRVYTGTRGSLEISDNAGLNWKRAEGIHDSIGQIVVNPADAKQVFALPGERQRWSGSEDKARGPQGKRDFYLSNDRGQTWQIVPYAPGEGRRDILSFNFDQSDAKTSYIGAVTGIFRSRDAGKTWNALPAPEASGDCLGATLSPDGKILYASFRVPSDGRAAICTTGTGEISVAGHSELFAAPVADPAATMQWTNLSQNAPGFALHPGGATMFWRPRLDPRSSATNHRLLIGTYRPQHGLWEVNVAWNGENASAKWKRILWYDLGEVLKDMDKAPFDMGWEHWGIMGEDYHFAPLSWKQPLLFATGGQTLFATNLAEPDYATKWQPRYTWQVGQTGPYRTYRTRGANCTYAFTGDMHENYMIQANADNGVLESWDSGYSWTEQAKPGSFLTSRCNDAIILKNLNPPLVIAHAAIGWGAGVQTETSAIWAKRLVHHSPQDEWVQIAGGTERLAGLWRDEYTNIAFDPHNPKRIAIGLRFNGVFLIDDVAALYEAAKAGKPLPLVSSATKLALPPKPMGASPVGNSLIFDPNAPNVLWISSPDGLWKGTQNGGEWQWQKILADPYPEFAAWDYKGQTLLAVSRTEGQSDQIVVSRDGGKNWKKLLGFDDVKPLRQRVWYRPQLAMRALGLVGDGDNLYFNYGTTLDAGTRPYGFFRATLNGDALVKVEDFTADMPFPYPLKNRVIENGGQRFLISGTRGNGLWRRAAP